ncbi:hydrolase/acyltransferase, putative [Ixodes scapularis]|uniref:Hydrolase/acyltransferase, putative n=1 Tax=Ixodes scapularis TaxID=6945 RepID=B7Q4Q6_IXOSC|nr:hydrolase/acyltransferase, putative [Ixodes scapularis]|eukprot:XP_002411594.1 hydrolase/acyltransferase, putative [Ixodes scapularis]
MERRISVRTCGPLYRQWKQTKSWYRRAPEDGIEVDVPFVFTRRDDGGDLRFSIQNEFFWHSIEERTALLRDFLRQLGITRIDALVAHSAATFTSLRILLERQEPVPTVKSLVLLAPNSHITPSVLKPRWLKNWMAESYRNEILRPFVKAIILSSCYLGLSPVKPDVDNAMLSLITYCKSGYREGDKLLEAVARMKLPTLVAISRNDRLLSYSLFLEVCAVLGASEGDMWHFDGEGRMLRSGELYAL